MYGDFSARMKIRDNFQEHDNLITRIDASTFSIKKHLIRVDLYATQSSSWRVPASDCHHREIGDIKSRGQCSILVMFSKENAVVPLVEVSPINSLKV